MSDADAAALAKLAEQAARLCKADLVTEMVGEFPELQGLMGGYYAAKEGLPTEVAAAIRDHYKPVGQGDVVPIAPVTVAVSLADKLDTLVGFFAIDEKPTGSKDPFALRRAVLGVATLIMSNDLRLVLSKIIEVAIDSASQKLPEGAKNSGDKFYITGMIDVAARKEYDRKMAPLEGLTDRGGTVYDPSDFELPPPQAVFSKMTFFDPEQVNLDLLGFFADHLKVQQREEGVRHDLIDAIFALGGEDDLVRLLARVKALQAFVETPDGTNLLAGYKRAANILKQNPSPLVGEGGAPSGAEGEGLSGDSSAADAADPSPTPLPQGERAIEETALLNALDAAEPKAASAIEAEDFAAAMTALASLRAPIDAFFDNVMVNDEDEAKRAFRLGLLARFRDAVHKVADFSKIEG